MQIDKTLLRASWLGLVLLAAACATVADLEVTPGPRERVDGDDPAAPPAEASADGGAGADTSAPPVDAGATIDAAEGSFLHCTGGDVANGRVCCFTSDLSRTFYAASCEDAGPQVCIDVTECSQGTCESMTCRGVALKTCGPMGEARPSCP